MDSNNKETFEEKELKAEKNNIQAEGQINKGSEEQEASQEKVPQTKEEELETKLEEALALVEDQKDKYLRLSAEFDNFRKRTMKEKAELILNGTEKSISSMFPVIDDFERAAKTIETATDIEAIKEGITLIYNKFIGILGQNGVKAIETKEKELNTDYHEAIAVIPSPSEELKGKILDCVQTGYTLNEKVIRHAKVVVGE